MFFLWILHLCTHSRWWRRKHLFLFAFEIVINGRSQCGICAFEEMWWAKRSQAKRVVFDVDVDGEREMGLACSVSFDFCPQRMTIYYAFTWCVLVLCRMALQTSVRLPLVSVACYLSRFFSLSNKNGWIQCICNFEWTKPIIFLQL